MLHRALSTNHDDDRDRGIATIVDRALTRAIDITVALTLLLLVAPALLVAAILVRIDSPGPAIFRQERVGRNGRRFDVLKLRTMHVDNDDAEHRAYVAALIRNEAEAHDGMFKLVDDPRITRVGRVLRKWSIDELPQLWTVLRGQMSLVGPRPSLPHEVELYPPELHDRLSVKPGLTGLAQVRGRCALTFEESVQHDIEYARSRSVTTDVAILARTPLAVLSRRGAA